MAVRGFDFDNITITKPGDYNPNNDQATPAVKNAVLDEVRGKDDNKNLWWFVAGLAVIALIIVWLMFFKK